MTTRSPIPPSPKKETHQNKNKQKTPNVDKATCTRRDGVDSADTAVVGTGQTVGEIKKAMAAYQ